MVHDQAPEGRHRRQARRPVHQGRARDQRGGATGRRRPRRQLPAAPRDREGALGQHAGRQHQADDRQGDRRRRGRAVRGDRLRGLRPGRRRGPRRGPDRQPQPDRGRGPLDVHQVRRPAGRLRRRRLAVRAARPDLRRRATASTPTRSPWPRSMRAPRTSTPTTTRRSRSTRRRPSSRPSARRSKAPASRSSRPSRRWSPSRPSSSIRRRRARRCASSSCSRTSTTSQRVTANFDIPEDVFAEVAG